MERIKAIPTERYGQNFRSKLEASFADWLEDRDILWEYEPEVFKCSDGPWYLPDFWLPELKTVVEVKGVLDRASLEKVKCLAIAGAMVELNIVLAQSGWRFNIVHPDGELVEADWFGSEFSVAGLPPYLLIKGYGQEGLERLRQMATTFGWGGGALVYQTKEDVTCVFRWPPFLGSDFIKSTVAFRNGRIEIQRGCCFYAPEGSQILENTEQCSLDYAPEPLVRAILRESIVNVGKGENQSYRDKVSASLDRWFIGLSGLSKETN